MSIQIPREAVRYDVCKDGDRRLTLLEIKKGPDGQPHWWTVDESGRGELIPLKPSVSRPLPGIAAPAAAKQNSSGRKKSGCGWRPLLLVALGAAAACYHFYSTEPVEEKNPAGASSSPGETAPFRLKSAPSPVGRVGEELSYSLLLEPVPDSIGISGLPPGMKWREETRTLTGRPVRKGEFAVRIKARRGALEGEVTLMIRIEPPRSGKTPLNGPPHLSPAEWRVTAGRSFAVEVPCPEDAEFSAEDGLPAGVSLDGRILRGILPEPGRHEITVTARNPSGEDKALITLIGLEPPAITPVRPVPAVLYANRPLEIRIRIPEAARSVKWDGPLPEGVTFRKINPSEWALKGVPRREGIYEGRIRASQETESEDGGGISLPVSLNVEKASLAKQWWTATCDRNSDLEADLVSYPFSLVYKDQTPEVYESRADFVKMIYNRDFSTQEIRMSHFTEEGQGGALTMTRISPVRTNVVGIKFRFRTGAEGLISRMELDAEDASSYAPAFTKANIGNFLRAYLAAGSWSGTSPDDPAERQSAFFSPSQIVRYFNESYRAGPGEGRFLRGKLRNDCKKDMARKASWTYQPEHIEIEIKGDSAVAVYHLNAVDGGFPRHKITIKATAERLEIVSADVAGRK